MDESGAEVPGANYGNYPTQSVHIDDDDLEYFDLGNLKDDNDELEAVREHDVATILQALGQTGQSKDSEVPSTSGDEDDPQAATFRIKSIKVTQEYIKEICAATLNNRNLEKALIDQLRNPPEEPTDISNPDIRLSLDLYMAITNMSDETYTTCRNAILQRHPNSHILSLYSVKKLVAEITGVVAVYNDMCINSCHAFTGPFAQLESCTICHETQYHAAQLASTKKKVPRQHFCTILLGPQLQALRRSHAGALDMCYLNQKMKEMAEMLSGLQSDSDIVYDDIHSGSEMQGLANRIKITSNDTIISSSLDGAQLYQNKKSDTWISIWILDNLPPNQHYKKKHILPGTIIPDTITYHFCFIDSRCTWDGRD